MESNTLIRWFEDLTSDDVNEVGGKNASLGEMIQSLKAGQVRVPDGFATTADAYWKFVYQGDLKQKLQEQLEQLEAGRRSLAEVGPAVRKLFLRTDFPEAVETAIRQAYQDLSQRYGRDELDVAVRSSATAEDLPEASFAGQQETFLNVQGEDDLLEACRRCYASLFTNRAISYRQEKALTTCRWPCRWGCSAWCGLTGQRRGDVFYRYGNGLSRCGHYQCRLGAGGNRGAGQRYPRPVHGI